MFVVAFFLSRIFHPYEALCSAVIAIEKWGFFLSQGTSWCFPWQLHLLPNVYDAKTATSCFYDITLSLSGFEHQNFHLFISATWWGGTDCTLIWGYNIDSVYNVYHNNLYTCNFTTFTGNIQLCISWIYTITHLTSHECWWCSRVYTTVIMHIMYISYHVHIIKIDTVRLTGDIWLHVYLHVSWPYITYIIYNIVKTYLCSDGHPL